MRITVFLVYVGEDSTWSTIFFTNPSNRSSFEEDGWPSTNPLGLTKDTAGSVPPLISEYRLVVSWICAATCSGFAMMEVSYWNGLQMLQYSSEFGPLAPTFSPYGSGTYLFHWSP